ncbi:MAG: Zn-ribbon domain-containing OB-fold protein [Pseudomonadales bacterium]|nr:Zn-ribbon domain-containing OB-fold protein [Pseudomonadales bacterium]
MKEIKRPLPRVNELDTKDFWTATKQNEFRYQQCDSCATVIFYPRRHCTGCTSGKLQWKVSAGKGTVYTYSVVRQSYHPFFRTVAPYTVAWIDLDEGPRILSNVIGISADEVSIGLRVQIEWEEHEELHIPLFKPA